MAARAKQPPVVQSFLSSRSVSKTIQKSPKAIAVALSGGPDSMALLSLLSQYCPGVEIHALTLDHGLRKESKTEAQQVSEWVSGWDRVHHHILVWGGQKPETGLMESARDARYDILTRWCKAHKIKQLWVGHHASDQVETFLFRLAKGSGLDGLGGMTEVTPYQASGVDIMRPLLAVTKDQIVDFCTASKIPFVNDPTNQNLHYARARLRQALPMLEEEGLSEKRLARTVTRLNHAREALDFYADKVIARSVDIGTSRSTIALKALINVPHDIRIRVIRHVAKAMGAQGYGPRLDRLEDFIEGAFADIDSSRPFTLGGFIFKLDRKRGLFIIQREKQG